MDFTTRDRYRHAIEKIAKRSRLHEADVARKAILLAGEGAAGNGPDDRAAHVGFYLIDKGLPRMERAAGVRLPFSRPFGGRQAVVPCTSIWARSRC